ncbi:hypothetical protein ABR737_01090 [Streptomyces sp. Edi2]|uniref:hypothetical protein n=1 Tax=Streptomyces sp. Edi2 TaxID=3162528 RepID=UPI00330566B2
MTDLSRQPLVPTNMLEDLRTALISHWPGPATALCSGSAPANGRPTTSPELSATSSTPSPSGDTLIVGLAPGFVQSPPVEASPEAMPAFDLQDPRPGCRHPFGPSRVRRGGHDGRKLS